MHILVVENDELTRETTVTCLEQAGHTTCWSSTGDGALRLLRSEGVELMLLDMGLPDRNGWDVRRAQLAEPTIATVPVIVISALSSDEVRACLTSNPMSMVHLVMSKPVDVDRLLKAIGHIEELSKLHDTV